MYEKLRTQKSSLEVPTEIKEAFEKALNESWLNYQNNGDLVDRFEDNHVECAFAKGFLSGCIYHEQVTKENK